MQAELDKRAFSILYPNDGGLYGACRYEDAGEAGDDDFMQAELDKLDQMGLTDHGRVD